MGLPPVVGAYGLLNVASKVIWINPIVGELEIARPTLVHEAAHAAQYCAGNGKLKLLGLDREPPLMARPHYLRYHNTFRRQFEREAYTLQVQADGLELAIALLDQHCQ